MDSPQYIYGVIFKRQASGIYYSRHSLKLHDLPTQTGACHAVLTCSKNFSIDSSVGIIMYMCCSIVLAVFSSRLQNSLLLLILD